MKASLLSYGARCGARITCHWLARRVFGYAYITTRILTCGRVVEASSLPPAALAPRTLRVPASRENNVLHAFAFLAIVEGCLRAPEAFRTARFSTVKWEKQTFQPQRHV
jgi:hypothetical protein